MSSGIIQLPADSTGKKVQAWHNTIGADDAYTQASTPTDSSGVEILAATSTLQTSANTKLDAIATAVGLVTKPADTQQVAGTVAVSTSGLPTGAATSAAQATGNASVASIDTKTPALGQAVAGSSVPVVLPAAQITTLTPPAAITGFATSAKQDTGNTSLGSIDTKLPAQGQALAAASTPVVLPAAQITTLTPPAAITGFATSAAQTTGNTSVANIDTKTPALGQALAASAVPVVLTAIQQTALTPPAAITGFALETGGNLATLATNLPAKGQALAAASTPVVMTAIQIAALTPSTFTTGAAPAATVTGWTTAKVLSAASTNATSVKGTAARLGGYMLANTTAAWKYVHIHQKATAPTVGTDSPFFTIAVPPNGLANLYFAAPLTIATGLAYSITNLGTDLDATAVALGDVQGALFYV